MDWRWRNINFIVIAVYLAEISYTGVVLNDCCLLSVAVIDQHSPVAIIKSTSLISPVLKHDVDSFKLLNRIERAMSVNIKEVARSVLVLVSVVDSDIPVGGDTYAPAVHLVSVPSIVCPL